MTKGNFYITTPIYYVNDKPHIGHAYTSVACDVLARFKRLEGYHVKFLTGTDEHGQKVEKSAQAAGVSPQDFVDKVSQQFRDLTGLMNISNNDFIRTTEVRHVKSAQALWKRMQERGHIYLGSYAGWYAVRDEAYYQESELVNGKAPTGADVEWVEEPSYFFDLSKWQDKLLDFYDKNPGFIAPSSRRNEVISFVKGGLKDLSVSRTTFSWGIPVPGDDKHIMYVWLDALANYLSAVGFPDDAAAEYAAFWPPSLHMVGKDILRFHAVYWPAFLMAADLPLPHRVFAHGWWTVEGEKMSKSLGNVVAPADLVTEFGLDQTRYFLMREVPFGNDGNFSRERMTGVVNSELANNIGNLVQRTLGFIYKNCGGAIPAHGTFGTEDSFILGYLKGLNGPVSFERIIAQADACKFNEVIADILSYADRANSYIDENAPWTLRKEGKTVEMSTVLYVLCESIRNIAILLQPFMPDSSSKILGQLKVPQNERSFDHLGAEFALASGTPLDPPSPIFPRLGGQNEGAKAGAGG